MPATLCIWPNSRGPLAASTPGHAALEIVHNGRRDYVSWWPSDEGKSKPFNKRQAVPKTWEQDVYKEMSVETRRSLQAGTFQPRRGQMQMELRGPTGMQTVWVQGPHHRVELAGAGEGGTGVGLNLERISDWWHVFQRAENANYRFVSKTMNCASVVGTALIAGGAHLFTPEKFDEMSHGWHTPLDVMAFGEEILKGINRLVVFCSHFKVRADQLPLGSKQKMARVDWQTSMSRNNRNEPDLVAYPAWVALSDRNVKRFLGYARRKEQLAKIDTLLQEYHGMVWTAATPTAPPAPPNPGTWLHKVQLLNKLLEQVHDHMREKPDSDRAEAIFILGKQIVDVIDRYGDLA